MSLLKNIIDNLKSELSFEILDFDNSISNDLRIYFEQRSAEVIYKILTQKFYEIYLLNNNDVIFTKFLIHQGLRCLIDNKQINEDDLKIGIFVIIN